MRLRSLATLAATIATAAVVFACANDTPAAPKPTLSPESSALMSTATYTVIPLKRNTPLASDIVVSKTIGVLGGTIAIPGAGLTVVVPPAAVLGSTKITVTARAGSAVAYDFAPAGIHFLAPLVVTQSLVGTQGANGLLPTALGYYPNSNNITSVTELLSVQVNLLNLTAISTVWHFSGYIFATGEE